MKIRYIYNSSFHIETEHHQFLIDYYRGNFRLHPDKPCTFIVTHAHADHFDPMIFNLARPGDHYLLSSDTAVPASDVIHLLEPNQQEIFGDIHVQTCGSTDAGLSIRVEVDGHNFVHAGDLNLWIWPEDSETERDQMTADFLKEVDCFDTHKRIDVVFAAVDPRLGERYLAGPLHFITSLRPRYFVPMHFRENDEILTDFFHRSASSGTRVIALTEDRPSIELDS